MNGIPKIEENMQFEGWRCYEKKLDRNAWQDRD